VTIQKNTIKLKLLHDTVNSPEYLRVALHSKIISRFYKSENQITGWIYVGSHNISSTSWGYLENGFIKIKNFELGVLFAPTEDINFSELIQSLPYAIPAPIYTSPPWKIQKSIIIEKQKKLMLQDKFIEELNYHWFRFISE